MNCYDFIMRNFWWMGILIFIVVASLIFYGRTIEGHRKFSKFALKMPVFGDIILNTFITTFCNTTSTLFMSGVPVLETLDIIKGMTSNDVIKESISLTQRRIEEGENISAAMEESDLFPSIVIKMTQVGEQSGSLSDVFDKTSDYFQRKVEQLITSMTKMIEPVMMVCVGAIVLVTVIALYLPVFTMSDV
jgi:type IV pilus assembly protein PilC